MCDKFDCIIRNKVGNPISRSRNLRGIRSYVGKHIIKVLAIDAISKSEGKLMILFENGNSFETNFADFKVLKESVRNWRNTYGAPLRVNGVDCGNINSNNEALQ